MARNCASCGRANDDDARFCAGCGSALPADAPAPVQPVPVQPPPVQPAPYQPPPPYQPPTAAPAPGGPTPPRKGVHPMLIVLIVVIVVAVLAVAAFAALMVVGHDSGGGSDSGDGSLVTPTPTPASTYLWPGGQPFLAAASGPKANQLATLDAGGALHELATSVGGQIFQIAWAPDGSRLACIGGSWKRSQVWIYDGATGDAHAVSLSSPHLVAIDSLAWLSPSELLIAGFTTVPKNTGENAEFLIYDPAGDSAEPLADSGGVALRGVSVSASGDGSKVAFVTYTDQKTDQYGMASAKERLQVLDRGSGDVKELGSSKAFFDVNARAFDKPLISPSGTALIYRRAGSDVGTSYTVIDTNGVALMPTMESQFPSGYAWDPTGEKVVFTGHALTTGGNGIGPAIFYVFDITAGGKAQVIARYKDTMVQDLSWSPDGSTIAFAEYDQDQYQTGTVYLMSPSGGDAAFLVKGALSPVWAPGATGGASPAASPAP